MTRIDQLLKNYKHFQDVSAQALEAGKMAVYLEAKIELSSLLRLLHNEGINAAQINRLVA
jgi:hypothetical protein